MPSLQYPPPSAVWAAQREQQVWLRLGGRVPGGLAEACLPWQGLADPVEHRSRGLRGGGESGGPVTRACTCRDEGGRDEDGYRLGWGG